MKKIIYIFSFILLTTLSSYGQVTFPECEEAPKLDMAEKIDQKLGVFTTPFVKAIFYSITLQKIQQNYTIDLNNPEDSKNLSACSKDGILTLSGFTVADEDTLRQASSIKLRNKIENVKVDGAKLIIKGDVLPENIELQATHVLVGVPWVLFPLIIGALFFTIYFKFPNIRLLPTSLKIVSGDFEDVDTDEHQPNIINHDNPDTIRIEGAHGEVTHFQALTAALSATVGLGNIAGVAVAVVIGGAGATFWMIIAGLLGMSSKFVECTLGVKYREVGKDGTVYGGPMYYLKKGFGEKGYAKIGKVLAVLFAILCVGGSFGGGNMFQSNQATSILLSSINIQSENLNTASIIMGITMSVLVGIVIIGGIKRIAQVTEKIVPFMAAIYVGAALIILVMNYSLVPSAIQLIISKAFAPTAITGGLVGVLIQGFRRAAFSNEAGVGSAAIAHSAVKTKYPASEGLVALLEPLIDTVVICSMTAIVIVIGNLEGLYAFGGSDGATMVSTTGNMMSGVDLTSFVFDINIPGFKYVLTGAVVLFAFSTMISWSYYGLQSWTFLFGKGKTNELVYKFLFCSFVVIGAAAKLGNVLDFSDAMIFGMMVPNMIGLLFLFPKVKDELTKYLKAIKSN